MRAAIFLMDFCVGSVIHGILDILLAANYTLVKSGREPMFRWHTVSIDGAPVTPVNGLKIAADYSLEEYLNKYPDTDVWILPAFFSSASRYDRIELALDQAQPLIPVIQQHHNSDRTLLSICSGSFLLARADLMQNRPASMHWQLEPHFRRMFPSLRINTEQAIADYGNIISVVGGHIAYGHTIMLLVERYAGHDTAVDTARLMMMKLNPSSPQPFRIEALVGEHDDPLVERAEHYLELRFTQEISMQQLAQACNLSERQLTRRFIKALDCTPLQYLQRLRLRKACQFLESSRLPSSKIVFEIGYQDESSFRRLFKKQMSMTMEDYRQRFGRMDAPGLNLPG